MSRPSPQARRSPVPPPDDRPEFRPDHPLDLAGRALSALLPAVLVELLLDRIEAVR
jgi:hypothetical protein